MKTYNFLDIHTDSHVETYLIYRLTLTKIDPNPHCHISNLCAFSRPFLMFGFKLQRPLIASLKLVNGSQFIHEWSTKGTAAVPMAKSVVQFKYVAHDE